MEYYLHTNVYKLILMKFLNLVSRNLSQFSFSMIFRKKIYIYINLILFILNKVSRYFLLLYARQVLSILWIYQTTVNPLVVCPDNATLIIGNALLFKNFLSKNKLNVFWYLVLVTYVYKNFKLFCLKNNDIISLILFEFSSSLYILCNNFQ